MGGTLPWITGGLGLWQAGQKQAYTPVQAASYEVPGGTQTFDPLANTYKFVESASSSDIETQRLADLFERHLYDPSGGGTEAWRAGLEKDITGIQGQLGGDALGDIERPSFDQWLAGQGLSREQLGVKGRHEAYEQYLKTLAETGEAGGLLPEERTALETELASLQDLLSRDYEMPYSPFGVTGEERQLQIGEQTGALEDLLTQRAQESYQQQKADLARRGVTGGTPEFELGERQAQTLADIGGQVALHGENLRAASEQEKRDFLNLILRGESQASAQQQAAQQLAQQFGLGQQALQQEASYNQWLRQQQQQQALQNVLGLAGQTFGYGFGGGGGGQEEDDTWGWLTRGYA